MRTRQISLLILCMLFLGGCARPVNRAAERKIRDALPNYVGPARLWRAHVENPPDRTARGRLSRVIIDGTDVELRHAVQLSRLHIEMNDAEVDVRRGRLTSVGETTFSATVTEPALNAFISRTASPEDSVKVRRIRLLSQQIVLEAAYLLLGREVGFRAEIEPRLASPQRLEFDPERFALFGINVPLPRAALRWVSGRLTDGFDFSTLPFPVQIRSVNVRTGLVDIAGTADVMRSLNERISYFWRR